MKPLNPSKPHIIVMVGIPGAGKSFFAEHFASTFNTPYINFDRLRNELFSEPTYQTNETALVRRLSDYMLDELFKTRQTIIYDGPTEARTDRENLARHVRRAGYEILFVWVQTAPTAALTRATKSTKTKQTISPELFNATLKRFTAPNAHEKAVVISGKHTFASQLKIVLKRLVEPRIEAVQSTSLTAPGRERRHIAVR